MSRGNNNTERQLYTALPQNAEITSGVAEEVELESLSTQPDIPQIPLVRSSAPTPIRRKPVPIRGDNPLFQRSNNASFNAQSATENAAVLDGPPEGDAGLSLKKGAQRANKKEKISITAPDGWPLAPSVLNQSDYWTTTADVLMGIGAILFLGTEQFSITMIYWIELTTRQHLQSYQLLFIPPTLESASNTLMVARSSTINNNSTPMERSGHWG